MGLFRIVKDFITDNFSSHKPYISREGYEQSYRDDCPYSRSSGYRDGYIPTHLYNAIQKYGRPPASDEVIHHVDGNKLNNHPSNLVYMKKWQHDKRHGYDKYGYPKKGNRRR